MLISGSGALGTSGSVLNLHNGDTALVTVGALISGGAGGLYVDGPGTTALTATNTYTSATIIGVGSTLQIGSAGSLNSGSYAGAISNNGTLEYSSSAAQTLSGVVSGPGGITKDAASSTLALTNTNTFTGPLTINAGTVTLPGGTNATFETGNPNIVVNNGGTLSFSGYNTFGLTTSSISAVTVNFGGTILSTLVPASNYVTVFNNLTLNSGTVSVNGSDLYGGSWGTFGFGGTTTATGTSVINVVSGSGTIGNASGNSAITAFTINTPALTDSLTISAGIQSSMSLVKLGSGTLTLSAADTYSGGTTINAGTVQINKATGLGTGTATINSGTTLDINFGTSATAFSNAITGSGTINLSAAAASGTTTPPFDPSSMAGFTGTVTINTNFADIYYQLNPPSGSTFDGSAIPWVVNNQISNSFVYMTASLVRLGSLSGNGTIGAGSTTYTLEVGALGTSTTFSGVLENSSFGGTLSFSKVGAGTLILTGVNTYGGTTSISGGTLQIGSAGSLGAGSYAGAISDNASLEYSSSAAQTFSGIISGSGALAKDTASSTLTLSNANTYTGGTSVSAGILRVSAISDSSTSNIGPSSGPTNNILTLGGGTLQYTGAGLSTTGRNVSLTANGAIVLSGGSGADLDLTGTLSDNSSGFGLTLGAGSTGATLTLGGTNTYLGATNVTSATLNLAGSLASTTASVASGATLTGTGGMSSAALAIAGGGTVTLASANSASALTVGSLALGSSGSYATLNYTGGVNGIEYPNDLGTLTPNDVYVNITGSLAVSATPYTLLNLASPTALNNFSLSNSAAGVYSTTVGRDVYTINGGATASALTVTVSGAPNPAVAYWDGAVSTTWNDLSNATKVNWSTDPAGATDAGNIPGPVTDVILGASNNTNNNLLGTVTTTLGANLTINSLNVNGNRTNTIAAGNTLTINALADGNIATELPSGNPAGQGIAILSAANAFTINAGVTLGGSQAWINGSPTLFTVGGAVTGSAGLLGSQTLTLQDTGAGNTLISGAIGDGSNGGNLALLVNSSGSGTVTLSNANTFTGNTTVSAGTLILANSLALQDSVLTTGGAGIVFSSTVSSHAFTFGDLSGSANLALTDNSSNAVALTVGGSGDSPTYSGSLNGGGSLTKIGVGTLTLSGANTYSGATTVSGGTLAIAGGSLSATDQVISQSGGALTITNGSVIVTGGGGLGVG